MIKEKTFIRLCYLVLGLMIALQLSVTLTSAADLADNRYPANKEVELNFRCTLNGAIPSALTQYNFTIEYPNGTIYLTNRAATPQGQGMFSYTTSFNSIGVYKVHQFCYDGIYSYSNSEPIDVTTTGDASTITMTAVIILLIFSLILFLFAISTENEYIGFISGLLFTVTGVFIMIYGFGNLANMYTQAIAYVSIGWGIILVTVAGWKILSDITGTGSND
jgi:hypothetical protein